MLSPEDILLRLFLASLLGAVIGLERERHGQPAGLRTHMILTIGAALAMCISIEIASQFKGITVNGDPERIAAQVVSGIGFLGAGAIFRFGTTVKGLTTAVSLWTMAIVGLAVGGGYILLSTFSTLLILLILVGLDFVEKKFIHSTQNKTILIEGDDHAGFVSEVRILLSQFHFKIKAVGVSKQIENNLIEIEAIAKVKQGSHDMDKIIGTISKINGIKKFTIR